LQQFLKILTIQSKFMELIILAITANE